MSIQLSAKKEQTGYDIVHNSQNTSAVTAQRILNTTPEQANMDYLLDYLIENFADVKASWESKIKEAHENKILMPVKDKIDRFKEIISLLKMKGGDVNIKPDPSAEYFNVAVDVKFKNEFTINSTEISMFNNLISEVIDFEMDTCPTSELIQVRFTFKELGRYVERENKEG